MVPSRRLSTLPEFADLISRNDILDRYLDSLAPFYNGAINNGDGCLIRRGHVLISNRKPGRCTQPRAVITENEKKKKRRYIFFSSQGKLCWEPQTSTKKSVIWIVRFAVFFFSPWFMTYSRAINYPGLIDQAVDDNNSRAFRIDVQETTTPRRTPPDARVSYPNAARVVLNRSMIQIFSMCKVSGDNDRQGSVANGKQSLLSVCLHTSGPCCGT